MTLPRTKAGPSNIVAILFGAHTALLPSVKVCLDARLDEGAGGVHQFVMGLAYGLSGMGEGEEEYSFLTNRGEDDWLQPYVSGPCRIVPVERPPDARLKMRLQRAMPERGASYLNKFRRPNPRSSDGTIERLGIDVMHFTHQAAFLTDVPSLYQPHDLQHFHFPQFFSRDELRFRKRTYSIHCKRAKAVVMMSSWGKRDLMEHLALPEESVHVVPGAPPLALYPDVHPDWITEARKRIRLPQDFVLYPANTWPHKNHFALLEALAILRKEHSLIVPLLCPGQQTSFYPQIESHSRRLGLSDQTRFLGFVSPQEMVALYRMSRALIYPSKFEGWGFPVSEAFWSGTPVACSDVTCLPSLAGDAALLFDPDSPRQIAEAIRRIWQDEKLQTSLREKGRKRASQFTWAKTARAFRALYRELSGAGLSRSDRELLLAAPLV